MMEGERVCCMCGDVGFPDKIFRCNKCHHRFQHSYCSNKYSSESLMKKKPVCEWCLSTDESSKLLVHHRGSGSGSSKKKVVEAAGMSSKRSEGEKIKQHEVEEVAGNSSEKAAGKSATAGAPSPRTSTRRYKLLKDVMC